MLSNHLRFGLPLFLFPDTFQHHYSVAPIFYCSTQYNLPSCTTTLLPLYSTALLNTTYLPAPLLCCPHILLLYSIQPTLQHHYSVAPIFYCSTQYNPPSTTTTLLPPYSTALLNTTYLPAPLLCCPHILLLYSIQPTFQHHYSVAPIFYCSTQYNLPSSTTTLLPPYSTALLNTTHLPAPLLCCPHILLLYSIQPTLQHHYSVAPIFYCSTQYNLPSSTTTLLPPYSTALLNTTYPTLLPPYSTALLNTTYLPAPLLCCPHILLLHHYSVAPIFYCSTQYNLPSCTTTLLPPYSTALLNTTYPPAPLLCCPHILLLYSIQPTFLHHYSPHIILHHNPPSCTTTLLPPYSTALLNTTHLPAPLLCCPHILLLYSIQPTFLQLPPYYTALLNTTHLPAPLLCCPHILLLYSIQPTLQHHYSVAPIFYCSTQYNPPSSTTTLLPPYSTALLNTTYPPAPLLCCPHILLLYSIQPTFQHHYSVAPIFYCSTQYNPPSPIFYCTTTLLPPYSTALLNTTYLPAPLLCCPHILLLYSIQPTFLHHYSVAPIFYCSTQYNPPSSTTTLLPPYSTALLNTTYPPAPLLCCPHILLLYSIQPTFQHHYSVAPIFYCSTQYNPPSSTTTLLPPYSTALLNTTYLPAPLLCCPHILLLYSIQPTFQHHYSVAPIFYCSTQYNLPSSTTTLLPPYSTALLNTTHLPAPLLCCPHILLLYSIQPTFQHHYSVAPIFYCSTQYNPPSCTTTLLPPYSTALLNTTYPPAPLLCCPHILLLYSIQPTFQHHYSVAPIFYCSTQYYSVAPTQYNLPSSTTTLLPPYSTALLNTTYLPAPLLCCPHILLLYSIQPTFLHHYSVAPIFYCSTQYNPPSCTTTLLPPYSTALLNTTHLPAPLLCCPHILLLYSIQPTLQHHYSVAPIFYCSTQYNLPSSTTTLLPPYSTALLNTTYPPAPLLCCPHILLLYSIQPTFQHHYSVAPIFYCSTQYNLPSSTTTLLPPYSTALLNTTYPPAPLLCCPHILLLYSIQPTLQHHYSVAPIFYCSTQYNLPSSTTTLLPPYSTALLNTTHLPAPLLCPHILLLYSIQPTLQHHYSVAPIFYCSTQYNLPSSTTTLLPPYSTALLNTTYPPAPLLCCPHILLLYSIQPTLQHHYSVAPIFYCSTQYNPPSCTTTLLPPYSTALLNTTYLPAPLLCCPHILLLYSIQPTFLHHYSVAPIFYCSTQYNLPSSTTTLLPPYSTALLNTTHLPAPLLCCPIFYCSTQYNPPSSTTTLLPPYSTALLNTTHLPAPLLCCPHILLLYSIQPTLQHHYSVAPIFYCSTQYNPPSSTTTLLSPYSTALLNTTHLPVPLLCCPHILLLYSIQPTFQHHYSVAPIFYCSTQYNPPSCTTTLLPPYSTALLNTTHLPAPLLCCPHILLLYSIQPTFLHHYSVAPIFYCSTQYNLPSSTTTLLPPYSTALLNTTYPPAPLLCCPHILLLYSIQPTLQHHYSVAPIFYCSTQYNPPSSTTTLLPPYSTALLNTTYPPAPLLCCPHILLLYSIQPTLQHHYSVAPIFYCSTQYNPPSSTTTLLPPYSTALLNTTYPPAPLLCCPHILLLYSIQPTLQHHYSVAPIFYCSTQYNLPSSTTTLLPPYSTALLNTTYLPAPLLCCPHILLLYSIQPTFQHHYSVAPIFYCSTQYNLPSSTTTLLPPYSTALLNTTYPPAPLLCCPHILLLYSIQPTLQHHYSVAPIFYCSTQYNLPSSTTTLLPPYSTALLNTTHLPAPLLCCPHILLLYSIQPTFQHHYSVAPIFYCSTQYNLPSSTTTLLPPYSTALLNTTYLPAPLLCCPHILLLYSIQPTFLHHYSVAPIFYCSTQYNLPSSTTTLLPPYSTALLNTTHLPAPLLCCPHILLLYSIQPTFQHHYSVAPIFYCSTQYNLPSSTTTLLPPYSTALLNTTHLPAPLLCCPHILLLYSIQPTSQHHYSVAPIFYCSTQYNPPSSTTTLLPPYSTALLNTTHLPAPLLCCPHILLLYSIQPTLQHHYSVAPIFYCSTQYNPPSCTFLSWRCLPPSLSLYFFRSLFSPACSLHTHTSQHPHFYTNYYSLMAI